MVASHRLRVGLSAAAVCAALLLPVAGAVGATSCVSPGADPSSSDATVEAIWQLRNDSYGNCQVAENLSLAEQNGLDTDMWVVSGLVVGLACGGLLIRAMWPER